MRLLAVMEKYSFSQGNFETWPTWIRCPLFHQFFRFSNDSIGLVDGSIPAIPIFGDDPLEAVLDGSVKDLTAIAIDLL